MPYSRAELLSAIRTDHPEFKDIEDNRLFAAIAVDHPDIARGISELQEPAVKVPAGTNEISPEVSNLGALTIGVDPFTFLKRLGGAAASVINPLLPSGDVRKPNQTLPAMGPDEDIGAKAATLGTIAAPLTEPGANLFNTIKGKVPSLANSEAVNKWMDVAASEVKHGANPGQRLLDDKLLGATKQATKANVDAAMSKVGQQIDTQLAAADQSGVTHSVRKIINDALDNAEVSLKSPSDTAFANRIAVTKRKLDTFARDLDNAMPSEIHKLKTYIGDSINWKTAVDDPINDAFKEMYSGLNNKVKSNVGGMANLQAEWADLSSASRNLRDSIADDVVGKGSGSAAPGSIKHLVKKAAPYAVGTGVGSGLFYELRGR